MRIPLLGPAGRRVRLRYLFTALAFSILPFLLWRLAEQPQAVHLVDGKWAADPGEYAGVDACRECHASIVDEQLASSHAQTVREITKAAPRAPFGNGQQVLDPLTGARYSTERHEKECRITLALGGMGAGEQLEYEFGAGRHAYGYLAKLDDGTWIDARLNYYPPVGKWDFTSSQDKPQKYLLSQPLGKPQQPDDVLRCFACHSTVVRADNVDRLPQGGSQMRVRPDRSTLNVTCESCHGPRRRHVRDLRAGKPADATKQSWPADEMNQVCGKCHGLANIDEAHPVIARFQPYGLSQSACFRASAGRLSCSTCHDPHSNARRDTAFYEAKCIGCHSGAAKAVGKTVCPVDRKSGCVGCHMPEDTKSMLHTRFVDHRIRVVAEVFRKRSGP